MAKTRSITTAERKRRSSDRHKQKGDDRHKNKPNDGHRCCCGYHSCPDLQQQFRGTNTTYDRRPISFQIKDDESWKPFFDSLMRNLHVAAREDDKLADLQQAPTGHRFHVAAHHFTEDVVKKYFNGRRGVGVWKVRLDRKDAEKVLHIPLDKRDTDNGKYFINANNPVVGAAIQLANVKSGRTERASDRSSVEECIVEDEDDPEKEAMKRLVEKLTSENRQLTRENRVLKQKAKRRADKVKRATEENKRLKDKLEDALTMDQLKDIIESIGGLSRVTLLDESFHKKYKGAAKCLWGLADNFDETLTTIECLFEDVDINKRPTLQISRKRKLGKDALPSIGPVSDLEKCLLTKLFFRRDMNEEFIALIFGKHRTSIGKYLKEWAPRWGKAGEQCSILDITLEYLDSEEPDRSKQVGTTRKILVDGADTTIEGSRKDYKADAIEYGSKNKTNGARCMGLRR